MSTIIWKTITGYDNYSVSNMGDIKNNATQRILKTCVRNGYKSISLSNGNVKKTYNVHTIVANTFIEKPSGRYVVNHKDENKLNNNVSNLEYMTYKDNMLYSKTSKRSCNTNVYDLSSFSDIPNYTRYMVSKKGEIYSKNIKRLCCITILPNGYHKIKLKSDNNAYKDMYVHVIVAMTYLKYTPLQNNLVINHIDGIKGNNILENLEIVSQKQNMQHSVKINNDRIFRRAVYYIDDNNMKITFKSALEASKQTGIDNSSILKSCKSINKKAGNIKWHYMSDS